MEFARKSIMFFSKIIITICCSSLLRRSNGFFCNFGGQFDSLKCDSGVPILFRLVPP